MKFIIGLAIAIVFLICGVITIISPAKIKFFLIESDKRAIKDWGASDEYAENWVKKYVVQNDLHYRIAGIICTVFGVLLFYAVIKTLLKS